VSCCYSDHLVWKSMDGNRRAILAAGHALKENEPGGRGGQKTALNPARCPKASSPRKRRSPGRARVRPQQQGVFAGRSSLFMNVKNRDAALPADLEEFAGLRLDTLAASITITAASTAVTPGKWSSEKSL